MKKKKGPRLGYEIFAAAQTANCCIRCFKTRSRPRASWFLLGKWFGEKKVGMVGGECKADMHADSIFSRNDPRTGERGKPHCRPLVRRPVLGLAWAVSTLGSPPPPRPHCWPTSAIGGADIPGGARFSFLFLSLASYRESSTRSSVLQLPARIYC